MEREKTKDEQLDKDKDRQMEKMECIRVLCVPGCEKDM
jgi:hypothetical protein